jgi:hypothetical protein
VVIAAPTMLPELRHRSRERKEMDIVKYQKLALTAITGATALTLVAPATSASAASAPKRGSNLIYTSAWQKTEDIDPAYQQLHTTRKGKVELGLEYKEHNHAVGLRLISCKGHKALTGWKQMKKKVDWAHPGLYTTDRVLKKNTCFLVQAGRSRAGKIWVVSYR